VEEFRQKQGHRAIHRTIEKPTPTRAKEKESKDLRNQRRLKVTSHRGRKSQRKETQVTNSSRQSRNTLFLKSTRRKKKKKKRKEKVKKRKKKLGLT